jgi:transglutaminase-like putative cysteine protease
VPSLLPLRLAFGGELRTGNRYAVRLFDPVQLAERDVAVTVARETTLVVADSAAYDSTAEVWTAVLWDTVPAFRIEEATADGRRRVWVDAQGQVVRAEEPTGLVIERSAFEIAYENFRHRDTAAVARASARPPGDAIVATTALAAGIALPGAGPAVLRVRLGGAAVELDELVLGGATQVRRGDTLELRRAADSALVAHYLLPSRDTAMRTWLRAEPLIQTLDPRIAAQARRIVGRERNALRATQAIVRWLGAELRPVSTGGGGVASAVQALEQRGGDCQAYTALFVALARAAGLPARPVAGLLFREGRFYYHSWAEVLLDDWVPVDPLLGQVPADAGRLRLVTGSLGRRAELARLIGNLTLETL